MEIYSYVGTSTAARRGHPVKINYPKARAAEAPARPLFTPRVIEREKPVRRVQRTVRAESAEKSALPAVAAYFFVLVASCALIPLGIHKFFYYTEQQLEPFLFEEIAAENTAIIESAFEDFALGTTGEDFFVDEDGNVLSPDDVGVTAQDIGLGEPVTFSWYTVQKGESVSHVVLKFGLRNISSIISVNNISNVRQLQAGQKIRVPSMDGVIHKVVAGDSLNTLSVKYGVSVEELLDVNDLSSGVLKAGDEIFIPGAEMAKDALRSAMGELFIYPIPVGQFRFSSYFGKRVDPISNVASYHYGLDFAAPKGTPIKASMSGKVTFVGFSSLYGNYVVIDHGNGYQTLYGHMSKTLAKNGRYVSQGEVIGLVGSTGYSTGNHLHFTVYKNGTRIDPFLVLKKK